VLERETKERERTKSEKIDILLRKILLYRLKPFSENNTSLNILQI
jgi:hypothetical protein